MTLDSSDQGQAKNSTIRRRAAAPERTRRIRGRGLVAAILAVWGACGEPPEDSPEVHTSVADQDVQLADLEVVQADATGVPTFANGALGRIDVRVAKLTLGDEDAALRAPLARLRGVLHLDPNELILDRALTDNIGDRHYVFKQYKNGLEVIGAALVLDTRAGAIYSVHGKARSDLAAAPAAVLAAPRAVAAVASDATLPDHPVIDPQPALAYRLIDGKLVLVYRVRAKGMQRDGLPVDDEVLVSAIDGSIIGRIPHIQTAKSRKLYNAGHSFTLPGTLLRVEGGAPVADAVANTSYDLVGTSYDCYRTLFGRDSLDNAGLTLVSSVHVGQSYVNAFWDGTQLAFGDGDGVTSANLALALDIAAHELTHGVTSNTSDLVYAGESGGLNESMSDIFGAVCSWYRDGGVVSDNTWKMGEEVWTPAIAGDALRYMNDPRRDGPSLDFFADYTSGVDVHYSSGIPNLAFYLLSQGGRHPRGRSAVTVSGIGIARAAQIFYRTNTVTLLGNPDATFAETKIASEQAAAQLGYSSADIAAVGDAWLAVGVGLAAPACAHDRCAPGAPLAASCNWCADAVCAVDSFCCTGAWDSVCVSEVESACNSLRCTTAPACGHSECTPGAALAASCHSCAASICDADPFCCTSAWDSVCVSEVGSLCAMNCGG